MNSKNALATFFTTAALLSAHAGICAELTASKSPSTTANTTADPSAAISSVQSATTTDIDIDEKPYVPKHHETGYSGWKVQEGECTIKCTDPHAACAESEQVLETMKGFVQAYSRKDYDAVAGYLDKDCTTVDEANHQLVVGKAAVIEHLKKIRLIYESVEQPLVAYTIECPYAKVNGDTAVVSFLSRKKFGGKNPKTLVSHCTDIYKKENGKWVRLYYRSNYKEVPQS